MAVLAGGRQGFAAVSEQNLTVLDKQELVQIEIGSGQVTKGGPLSYIIIKRSHILNGRHILLCPTFALLKLWSSFPKQVNCVDFQLHSLLLLRCILPNLPILSLQPLLWHGPRFYKQTQCSKGCSGYSVVTDKTRQGSLADCRPLPMQLHLRVCYQRGNPI